MSVIDEMVTLRQLLAEVFTPSEVTVWLQRPNDTLGGERPFDAFIERGLDGVRHAIPRSKSEVESSLLRGDRQRSRTMSAPCR